jgi:hypothetical protein
LVAQHLLNTGKRLKARCAFDSFYGNVLHFLISGLQLLRKYGYSFALFFDGFFERLSAGFKNIIFTFKLFFEQLLFAVITSVLEPTELP